MSSKINPCESRSVHTSSKKRRIVVLGSTGSIGVQTLDVVRRHPDKLEIIGLAAGTRAKELLVQAQEFNVAHLPWALVTIFLLKYSKVFGAS